MTAYLQLRDGERWDPCSSLLAAANRYAFRGFEKNVIALLERWQKISSALGREEEGHALALQIAMSCAKRSVRRAATAIRPALPGWAPSSTPPQGALRRCFAPR